MKKRFFIIVSIVLFVFSPFSLQLDQKNISRAATEIGYQNITADTTWDLAGSPYLITLNIYINKGITLTIEPGVIIKLGRTGITVGGKLNTIGTEENPIIFTSINDDDRGGKSVDWSTGQPTAEDWRSITIDEGGELNLNHATINYGGTMGVYQCKNNNFIKQNTALAFNIDVPVVDVYGKASINNSEISHNTKGIAAHDNSHYVYGQAEQLPATKSIVSIHNSRIFDNSQGGAFNNGTGQIDATNNWWGDDSGPLYYDLNPNGKGDKIIGNALFDPWIGKTAEKKRNPVIIVPGIISSYINKNEPGLPELWPNIYKMLIPGDDSYLYDLSMNQLGWPNEINTKPTDIFRNVANQDIFEGLIEEFKKTGYKENENLFVFPYDWRLDINWIAGDSPMPNTSTLKNKINEVLSTTGSEKVDIVAHSMGGLVTKAYMNKYGQDKIDTFIDIGTPHYGAPKALKMLIYGDNMGFSVANKSIVNIDTMKNISQNMPSIYDLLPSQAYQNIKFFSAPDPNYSFYIADIYDYDNNNVKGNLDYNASQEFMNNIGVNTTLLTKANNLHADIDNLNFDKIYNIIGCGIPTIGKIYILNKEKSGGYEYGLKYIDGDGTVPLKSADALNTSQRYYNRGTEHGDLPSSNGIKQLVVSIINNNQDDFNFNDYQNINDNDSNCGFNGTQVSFHSPIDLHVYDENNNHLGPNENGDIEFGIEGANYDIIDGNKFVFLPKGHIYKIVGQATDIGTFNARIQDIEDGNTIKEAYFNQVPLESTSTNIEYSITDNQSNFNINIDQDGDHVFEATAQPSSMLNEQESTDLIKPETSINISGTQGKDNWYTSSVQISLTTNDNEGGSGILKIEYSLDEGQTWLVYTGAITIDKQGLNKILFKSTDRAGNIEEEKTAEFKIDQTPPTLEMITPLANDEYDHAENLEIMYNSIDSTSGLNESATKMYINGQVVSTTSIDLFPYHLGDHQLFILVSDLAGNQTATTVPFSVVTSMPGAIDDINRLYSEKQITKANVKEDLIKELNSLQQYIERFGKQENKRLSKYQERLAKCGKRKKHAADCRELVKKLYERHEYVLSKINAKIVANRFVGLLKDLEKYYIKKWLTIKAYDIIKEDIKYLISDLEN